MIIFAVENKGTVYAYNEKREIVLNERGKLYHYTENTVAIKRNNEFYIYGEKGDLTATYPKDFVDISNIVDIFA